MTDQIDLQNLSEEADALADEFGPSTEQAEQLERQSQQLATQENAADEWAAILQMALGPGFAILAPNWGISPDEIKALSDAYAPCAAELFPDMGQAGPWVGAVMATAIVIGPRLGTPRKPPKPTTEKPVKGEEVATDDS